MMDGIESFFSDTAVSSMVAFLILAVVLGIVVYQLTKNIIFSSCVGGVLVIGVAAVYFIKPTIFTGLIQKFLNLFAIANHFDNFVGGIFDVTGIIYMLSVVCIFVFLTVQCIQKRRWS